MKQKTRILIYILIAAAVVIIGVIGILSGGKPGDSAREHLDLGRTYLEELSYDEAEHEFCEAIRIDPSDPAPYMELAGLYTDTDRDEMAVDILETGYKETGDENILKALDDLRLITDNAVEGSGEDTSGNSVEGAGDETASAGGNGGNNGSEGSAAAEAELAEVPDLMGLSEEEAVSLCEERGFLHSVSRQNSNDVKKGYVMGQSIPAGTMAEKGIGIPFEVSEGRVMVEIPDLTGLSEEEAKKVCGEIGIEAVVSYESSNDVPEGAVISQNIPAGAMAAEGASVRVAVSEGSALKVELLAQVEFDYLADFEESGWAFAVKGNKGGYVDLKGQFVEVYDDVPPLENEYYVYWEWDNGIGFAEGDGEWFNFESPFKVSVEGIYPYYSNNKWGYANINTGKVIVPCQYDQVTAFNCGRGFVGTKVTEGYNEGLCTYDIVDSSGNKIKCDKNITGILSSSYINNIAIIDYDFNSFENTAIIDVNGKTIESGITSQVTGGSFSYLKDYVIIYEKGEKNYSITPEVQKNFLFEGSFTLRCINKKYALFGGNGKNYIIDHNNGKCVAQYEVGEYNWYNYEFGNNRIARGRDDEAWTVFDFNGDRLIDSEYDMVGNPSYEKIGVQKNGKWGFIDPDGNLKIDFIYDNVYYYITSDDRNSLFMLCEDSTSSLLIDSDGNEVYRFKYSLEYLDKINGDNYVVTKNGDQYMIYKISE